MNKRLFSTFNFNRMKCKDQHQHEKDNKENKLICSWPQTKRHLNKENPKERNMPKCNYRVEIWQNTKQRLNLQSLTICSKRIWTYLKFGASNPANWTVHWQWEILKQTLNRIFIENLELESKKIIRKAMKFNKPTKICTSNCSLYSPIASERRRIARLESGGPVT